MADPIGAFGSLLPPRPVEDILAERVRLSIGGKVYDLPALSIEANEAWLVTLNEDVSGLLGGLNAAGEDAAGIIGMLAAEPDRLVDLLYSYDQSSVLLPREELRRAVTPLGLIRIVAEVWRAANPLVDIALAGMALALPAEPSPTRTSSPPRNGAGRRVKSGAS